MKINTKTRYGIRAMIELALNDKNEGLFQKDIARKQDISLKYLDHIIAALKASGLVSMAAGKRSGYRLAKEPDKITVYDIYNAFNPAFAVTDCLIDDQRCRKNNQCAAKDLWIGLNSMIVSYLKSTTIEDLAKKQLELDQLQQELMFHI